MINIGGDHKITLVSHQLKQFPVDLLWRINISVEVDMPGPLCPAGFLIREGIEASGIHIGDAETRLEIEKIPIKPVTAVGQTGSSGKAGPCTDDNGVCCFRLCFQLPKILLPAPGFAGQAGTKDTYSREPFLNCLLISVCLLL